MKEPSLLWHGGGKPFKISALHRLLHEKLYLGMIENKRTGQAFKGQHEASYQKNYGKRYKPNSKIMTTALIIQGAETITC